MAVTTTTELDDSVKDSYSRDYIGSFYTKGIWKTLFQEKMRRIAKGGRELAGKTTYVPCWAALAAPTDHLTETLDVTPRATLDDSTSVTIYEEGDVIQRTNFAELTAYYDIGKPIAEQIGASMAERLDKLIRDAICFGATEIAYGGDATTRVTCSTATTADTITAAMFSAARMYMQARGIEPFPDGKYVAVVNTAVETELEALDQWKLPGEYVNPQVIFTGKLSDIADGAKWPNEIGQLGNVRILSHPWGKLCLGAGIPLQAATTLTTAVAAGATSCTVTDATGLAAGNWITVGTLESATTARPTTEQLLITAVDGSTLTVRGAGSKGKLTDRGFQFAHASGVSVIEAPNVAIVPVMGPGAALFAYADQVGPEGRVDLEWAPSNIPKRFFNHSWYWVGGAAKVDPSLYVMEVATAGHMYGAN